MLEENHDKLWNLHLRLDCIFVPMSNICQQLNPAHAISESLFLQFANTVHIVPLVEIEIKYLFFSFLKICVFWS